MREKLPPIIFGINAVISVVAFGMTGKLIYAVGFCVLAVAAFLCIYTSDERRERVKREREDREAIEMLREAQDFEYLCDLREEASRRHIMERWEKL